MYSSQPDGTIIKTEVLSVDEVNQLLASQQAIIDGANADIQSFTDTKTAVIAEAQAVMNSLTPVVLNAQETLDARIEAE